MVSTIWGICFLLKVTPTVPTQRVLTRFCHGAIRAERRRSACLGLRVDPVFDFFQVRDYLIERRSFAKEHLAHVPVVASNLSDVGVWRAYPKASRPGQIVPRPSFPEEDLLMLYYACQQPRPPSAKRPLSAAAGRRPQRTAGIDGQQSAIIVPAHGRSVPCASLPPIWRPRGARSTSASW